MSAAFKVKILELVIVIMSRYREDDLDDGHRALVALEHFSRFPPAQARLACSVYHDILDRLYGMPALSRLSDRAMSSLAGEIAMNLTEDIMRGPRRYYRTR
jgi:hypothetical protein